MSHWRTVAEAGPDDWSFDKLLESPEFADLRYSLRTHKQELELARTIYNEFTPEIVITMEGLDFFRILAGAGKDNDPAIRAAYLLKASTVMATVLHVLRMAMNGALVAMDAKEQRPHAVMRTVQSTQDLSALIARGLSLRIAKDLEDAHERRKDQSRDEPEKKGNGHV
jgi:hypothetical protein